MNTYT